MPAGQKRERSIKSFFSRKRVQTDPADSNGHQAAAYSSTCAGRNATTGGRAPPVLGAPAVRDQHAMKPAQAQAQGPSIRSENKCAPNQEVAKHDCAREPSSAGLQHHSGASEATKGAATTSLQQMHAAKAAGAEHASACDQQAAGGAAMNQQAPGATALGSRGRLGHVVAMGRDRAQHGCASAARSEDAAGVDPEEAHSATVDEAQGDGAQDQDGWDGPTVRFTFALAPTARSSKPATTAADPAAPRSAAAGLTATTPLPSHPLAFATGASASAVIPDTVDPDSPHGVRAHPCDSVATQPAPQTPAVKGRGLLATYNAKGGALSGASLAASTPPPTAGFERFAGIGIGSADVVFDSAFAATSAERGAAPGTGSVAAALVRDAAEPCAEPENQPLTPVLIAPQGRGQDASRVLVHGAAEGAARGVADGQQLGGPSAAEGPRTAGVGEEGKGAQPSASQCSEDELDDWLMSIPSPALGLQNGPAQVTMQAHAHAQEAQARGPFVAQAGPGAMPSFHPMLQPPAAGQPAAFGVAHAAPFARAAGPGAMQSSWRPPSMSHPSHALPNHTAASHTASAVAGGSMQAQQQAGASQQQMIMSQKRLAPQAVAQCCVIQRPVQPVLSGAQGAPRVHPNTVARHQNAMLAHGTQSQARRCSQMPPGYTASAPALQNAHAVASQQLHSSQALSGTLGPSRGTAANGMQPGARPRSAPAGPSQCHASPWGPSGSYVPQPEAVQQQTPASVPPHARTVSTVSEQAGLTGSGSLVGASALTAPCDPEADAAGANRATWAQLRSRCLQPLQTATSSALLGSGVAPHAPPAQAPVRAEHTAPLDAEASAVSRVVPLERLQAGEREGVVRALDWATARKEKGLRAERAQLRHIVVEVLRPECGELRLRLHHPASQSERWAHLHGGWEETEACVGDPVNLVLPEDAWSVDARGTRHVTLCNASGGLLVLNPDILVSGTAVATSLRCARQAILQENVADGGASRATVLGTLMHELVQAALARTAAGALKLHPSEETGRKVGPQAPLPLPRGTAEAALGGRVLAAMHAMVTPLVTANALPLTEAGVTAREAERALRDAAAQLAATVATHFRAQRTQSRAGQRGGPSTSSSLPPASIEGLLDIEECIWSPKYGLKGVIDATVLVRFPAAESAVHGPSGTFVSAEARGESEGRNKEEEGLRVAAMEFKSGKAYHTHAGQLALYGLLLESRYSVAASQGLLWYATQPQMQHVKASAMDAAGLMMARNRLVAHKARGPWSMPAPLQTEFTCRSCYALPACALAHLALEDGNPETFGLPEHFAEHTAHVGAADTAFLRHWIGALELEQRASKHEQGMMWAMDPPPHVDVATESSAADGAAGSATRSQPNAERSSSGRAAATGAAERRGLTIADLVLHSCAGTSAEYPLYPHVYVFRQALPPARHSPAASADARNEDAERTASDAAAQQGRVRNIPLKEQGFEVGAAAVLSLQDAHPAVSRVRVVAVAPDRISLACRAPLPQACTRDLPSAENPACESMDAVSDLPDPDSARACAPCGGAQASASERVSAARSASAAARSVQVDKAAATPSEAGHGGADVLRWRIDKDDTDVFFQAALVGLMELTSSKSPLVRRLRGLIVHLEAPRRAARDAYQLECAPEPDHFEKMLEEEQQTTLTQAAAQQQERQQLHASAAQASTGALLAAQMPQHGTGATHGQPPAAALHARLSAPAMTAAARPMHPHPAGTPDARPGCTCSAAAEAAGGANAPCCTAIAPDAATTAGGGIRSHPIHMRECRGVAAPTPAFVTSDARGASGACFGVDSQSGGATQGAGAATGSQRASPLAALTDEQREVARRVLAWDDYVLVMGLPGTGKTTTISALVQELVAQGRTVLLTAYTNAAVDNMLRKLLAAGEERILRLGRPESVHCDVLPFLLSSLRSASPLEIRRHVRSVPIVASTCLSAARAALLKSRLFDVCILDEATQVSLPVSLCAVLRARTFVLVGDHYQLAPLVKSKAASAAGVGDTLFRRLSAAHPPAVVSLSSQFRSCAPIMQLSNDLTYGGQLRAGSERVAGYRIDLPRRDEVLRQCSGMPEWLLQAIDPALPLLWLDTSALATPTGLDALSHGSFWNRGEAAIVCAVTSALLACGLAPPDVGVTSPYTTQVSHLSADAARGLGLSTSSLAHLDIMTIDRFQGQDKAALVLSLVRSNEARAPGTLLADFRRVNVALTRARGKLVLVGNTLTVTRIPMLAAAVASVEQHGRVVVLPPDSVAEAAVASEQLRAVNAAQVSCE